VAVSTVLNKITADIEDRLSEVQLEMSELSLERARLEAALRELGVTSVRTRILPDPKSQWREENLTKDQQRILGELRRLEGARTAGELAHATNFQISSIRVYSIMSALIRYGLVQDVTGAKNIRHWEAVPRG
jgi:sugar-specific transcriptional regulator TrmB